MMEKLRVAANSIFVKIIFGIIILAFIFTGVSGFLGSGPSANDERLYIAKVDGEGISRAAFESRVQSTLQNAGSLMGSDDAFRKMVRQSVFSSEINDFLSYKFTDSVGAEIGDDQVKNAIWQEKAFHVENKFNNERFLDVLKRSGFTSDSYINSLRASLKTQQVFSGILLSDFSTPVESDVSALVNQNRTIYFTNYSINNLPDNEFKVSDDEINKYYNDNIQNFKHLPRLKIKYVVNSFPEIKRDIVVTENEIEQYYKEKKEGTVIPEKQRYSVASFNSAQSANEAYDSFKNAAVQDNASIKMETLGWFNAGESLPELFVKANLHEVGSISQPIEQNGTYYIVRLDNVIEDQPFPFDEVKNIIIDKIQTEKAQSIYDAQLTKLEAASKLNSIEQIAEESGLQLYNSDWNQEKEALSIARFPEIRDTAFSELMVRNGEPTGNISDIIDVPEYNSTYIIQVTDYQNEGILPFEEVKGQIHDYLLANKKKELFNQKLESILTELRQNGSVEGIQFSQRVQLNRNTKNDLVDDKTISDVFAVVPKVGAQRAYGATVVDDKNAQIFVLVGVDDGEITDMSTTLMQERIQQEQQSLVTELRSNAKIEIMPDSNL